MRLANVASVSNFTKNQVLFGRALRKEEEAQYKSDLQEGLQALGVKNFVIGMHAPSIPADKDGRDFGIGTPYGNSHIFRDLALLQGANGMQLGPNGKLDRGDKSPYVSSVFEKSPLLINPQMLVGEEFAGILSQEEINRVVPRAYHTTATPQVRVLHDTRAKRCNEKLMKTAFENYNKKLKEEDEAALKLKADFDKFLENNKSWIDYYSVLNVIADENKTDYYPNWKNPQDRTLIADYKAGKQEAVARYNEIEEKNKDAIGLYKFTQFIVAKQAEIDARSKGDDFMCIGDIEVGASKLDELVFGDIFLEGYCLGAPDGGKYNEPQFWGIKLLDPKKLFNEDGSLGTAGEFLKAKILNGLAGAKSIRIDHTIGLINPWVYKAETVKYVKINGEDHVDLDSLVATRVAYKSKEEPFEGIEGGKNFERVISEIILPAMKEAGIKPENIVWEDIGCDETGRFEEVFRGELNLSGLATMKWKKGEDIGNDTALISCHDDPTTREYIEKNLKDPTKDEFWNPKYLARRVYPGTSSEDAMKRNQYERTITSNPRELWNAKLIDTFSQGPKNIQLSFMDLFGISKRYNEPGTNTPFNWSLRLAPGYKNDYYKSLQNKDSWAINMPEIVGRSLEAKSTREGNLQENKELVAKLNNWAEVLKEEEK